MLNLVVFGCAYHLIGFGFWLGVHWNNASWRVFMKLTPWRRMWATLRHLYGWPWLTLKGLRSELILARYVRRAHIESA